VKSLNLEIDLDLELDLDLNLNLNLNLYLNFGIFEMDLEFCSRDFFWILIIFFLKKNIHYSGRFGPKPSGIIYGRFGKPSIKANGRFGPNRPQLKIQTHSPRRF
jgi:hypothetical protein